ncbi:MULTISPECIES: 5-oxoprolinase subunit PxpB [Sphingobacterium]|uniref:5-oxoprolinase subunit PxpB n=1 Tax=Sphingobacterium TaxID=28453 RepID=UPI0013DBEAFA|nr:MULTISPECIES: 5-oxoprolinase subunit PxpB [unclassified Sphingobacterium]
MDTIRYYPLGDRSVVLSFGDHISEEVNIQIRKVVACLANWTKSGIVEYVPAYTTITIYYDPLTIRYEELIKSLSDVLKNIPEQQPQSIMVKEIPVYYNGPDLAYVAQYNGLSVEEVIRIHSKNEYLVYMIGFVPGFPYLGGMDSSIATPRKEVPRLKIHAGAVGIAGQQTGIYPMQTPGGWQIIGHTPLRLFDVHRDKPSYLEAGDRLRFVTVDKEDFEHLIQDNYGY